MRGFRQSVVLFGAASLLGLGCSHAPVKTASTAPPLAVAAPVEAPKPAPTTDDAALLRAETLHFDFNADSLSPESQQRLDRVAKALRANPSLSAKVSGNCDERGTEEYNLALGQRRAGVAKRYLVQLGVEPQRVDTVSFGHEKPRDPAHTEAAWSENRRDDIAVTGAP